MNTLHRKSFTTVLLLLLLIAPFSFAQRGLERGQGQWQQKYKELEARRIAFITTELSLTPEEAQVFWPVYNEYNEKRNQMMIRHRNMRREQQSIEELSQEELLQIADADISNMEEMVALRREYHEKFKKILPIKKVIQLYDAERDFNRFLYKEGRGRHQMPGRERN